MSDSTKGTQADDNLTFAPEKLSTAIEVDQDQFNSFKSTELGRQLFEKYQISKKNCKVAKCKARAAAADVNTVKRYAAFS